MTREANARCLTSVGPATVQMKPSESPSSKMLPYSNRHQLAQVYGHYRATGQDNGTTGPQDRTTAQDRTTEQRDHRTTGPQDNMTTAPHSSVTQGYAVCTTGNWSLYTGRNVTGVGVPTANQRQTSQRRWHLHCRRYSLLYHYIVWYTPRPPSSRLQCRPTNLCLTGLTINRRCRNWFNDDQIMAHIATGNRSTFFRVTVTTHRNFSPWHKRHRKMHAREESAKTWTTCNYQTLCMAHRLTRSDSQLIRRGYGSSSRR